MTVDSARRERLGSPVSNTCYTVVASPGFLRLPSPRTARSMSPTQLLELSRQCEDLARSGIRARELSHRPRSDQIRVGSHMVPRRGAGDQVRTDPVVPGRPLCMQSKNRKSGVSMGGLKEKMVPFQR